MNAPAVWVIKASLKSKWKYHWKKYFADDADPYWWGEECISSTLCKKLLRNDVAAGDIAVCYQIDDPKVGRVIWALAQFKAVEREAGGEDFALDHHSKAFLLDLPLHIDELRETGCDPGCFKPGPVGRGTVGPIKDSEFKGIIDAIVAYSSADETKLKRWLSQVGWNVNDM